MGSRHVEDGCSDVQRYFREAAQTTRTIIAHLHGQAPAGVDGCTEGVAGGEAVLSAYPFGSLTPCSDGLFVVLPIRK
jgi:hypothetical protein